MSLMRRVAFNQKLVSQFNTRDPFEDTDTMVHGMLPGASYVLNDPSSYITYGVVPGDDSHPTFLESIASTYFGGRFVVGPHGSLLPVVEAPAVHVLDGRPVIMLEPEEAKQVLEPDVPSHILDHMYAKKYKEPGPSPTPKIRKRVRKKVPPIAVKNKKETTAPGSLIPDVAFISDSSNTKVNIIRKNVSTSTLRSSMLRPKILQNLKRVNPGESEIIRISPSTRDETSNSEKSVPSTSSPVYIPYYQELDHLPSTSTSGSLVRNPSSLSSSISEDEESANAASVNDEEIAQERFQEMCIMLPLPQDEFAGLTGTDSKTDTSLLQMAVPNENDGFGEVAVYSLASMDGLSVFPSISDPARRPVAR